MQRIMGAQDLATEHSNEASGGVQSRESRGPEVPTGLEHIMAEILERVRRIDRGAGNPPSYRSHVSDA